MISTMISSLIRETDLGTIIAAALLAVPTTLGAWWARKSKNELKANGGTSTKDTVSETRDIAVSAIAIAVTVQEAITEMNTMIGTRFDTTDFRLKGIETRVNKLEQK